MLLKILTSFCRPVSRLNRNRPEFAASLNRTMPSFPTESGTPKKGLNTSMKRRENRNKSPEPAAKKRILTEDLPEERLVIEEPKDSSEMADSAWFVLCFYPKNNYFSDLNQTAPVYRQQPVFMAGPPVPFSPSSWYHMYPPSPYVFYGGYPYQQLVSHHFTYESPRNYMYRPPMPHPASSSVHPSAFLPSPPTYLHYHQPSPARFHGPAAGMPLHSQTPVRR